MSSRIGLPVRLVVADTGPLITLAACSSLSLLGEFQRPVYVPDVIQAECMRKPEKLGYATLAAWFGSPDCPVEILPTPFLAAWRDAVATDAIERNSRSSLGIGDAAIAWLLRRVQHGLELNGPTLILTEDGPFGDGVLSNLFPEVHVLSTRAFLRTLENLGRIASAAALLAEVADAGRTLSRYMADRPGRPGPNVKTTWTPPRPASDESAN